MCEVNNGLALDELTKLAREGEQNRRLTIELNEVRRYNFWEYIVKLEKACSTGKIAKPQRSYLFWWRCPKCRRIVKERNVTEQGDYLRKMSRVLGYWVCCCKWEYAEFHGYVYY